jgi:rhodanese-related sulfurtransferase
MNPMRPNRVISFLLLAASVWAASACSAASITVRELQAQLTNYVTRITVIDVRAPALFARAHIPGAINIPASVCGQKNLPPLGKVVVCGEGLGRDKTDAAAAALAAKPGLSVDVLEGGFAAWEGQQAMTTRPGGLQPEAPNYISYSELKAAKPGETLLVDLRRRAVTSSQKLAQGSAPVNPTALTDLAQEFPGLASTHEPFSTPQRLSAGSSAPPLLVLIDDGDGVAEAMARTLRGNGIKRYAILMGGEMILARHGQAGLQRSGSSTRLQSLTPPPTPASK